jgi:S-adenosyl-L-methionine hydrolase (adenosine-forming)
MDTSSAAITLTTDFGLADGYVGTLKGVIYSINPAARVIDLSHDVAAQSIAEAAFVLYRAYRFFPPNTVHIAIVDPGVGSDRKCILLDTAHGRFVAPDNGLLTYVYQAERQMLAAQALTPTLSPGGERELLSATLSQGERELLFAPFAISPFVALADDSPGPPVYELSNPAYRLSVVSSTFHGRDVFAPAAAYLTSGVEPAAFGPRLERIELLPSFAPHLDKAGGKIMGSVLHIDRFGNLITNIDASLMQNLHPDRAALRAAVGRDNICPILHTYADAEEGTLLALVGSERLLEIAVRNGSAARRLGARVGDPVGVLVKE